jgi:hypothetical protein
VDLLKTPQYRTIPYEDLWRSAIRCKLIYEHHQNNHNHNHNHNRVYNLWKFINNIEDTQEIVDIIHIDDAYVHELRTTSEPVCFDTISHKKEINEINEMNNQNTYNTSVYLWNTTETIYITFHVDKNIEKDFLKQQTELVSISGCISVNQFFYEEMLVILNPILRYIENLNVKDPNIHRKIIISGYSLGGVIVQIISAVLSQIFTDAHISCHTFGSPKAGNCAFVKWFNNYVKEHYRVVNGNDPITMFPVGCNWSHIPNTTLQFDMDLHLNIQQEHIPWYKHICMKPMILHKIMKYYKHDHDFHIYITRLWKYTRITKYVETSRKMAEVSHQKN